VARYFGDFEYRLLSIRPEGLLLSKPARVDFACETKQGESFANEAKTSLAK
jgi:hypothetical protein